MTENRGDLLKAMLKVMSEVGYMKKDGKNAFHKYTYVSEANVSEKLRISFIANGLVLIPSCHTSRVERDGVVFVEMGFEIYHAETGQSVDISWCGSGQDVSKAGKMGDKGLYQAYTGAVKYFLMKTFLIPTGDDPEANDKQDKANAEPAKEEKLSDKEEKELEDMVDYIHGNVEKLEEGKFRSKVEEFIQKLDSAEKVAPSRIRAVHTQIQGAFGSGGKK